MVWASAVHRTPDSLSNREGLEVDLRAEQDGGRAERVVGERTLLVRQIRLHEADGAAEGHARAAGVNHATSPAGRVQRAVADCGRANSIGFAQAFVVVQVQSADLEGAGRVINANHPRAIVAVVMQAAIVVRIGNAKAELLPGQSGAQVPLVEVVDCYGGTGSGYTVLLP